MKSLSVKAIALLATFTLGFASCKKQSTEEKLKTPETTALSAIVSPDGAALAKLFRSVGPQFEFFKVQGEGVQKFTSRRNRVTYVIPSMAFVRPGGAPAFGPITLGVKEIFRPRDFVFADMQTGTGPDFLDSFGEFFVSAIDVDGTKLALAQGAAIAVQAPVRNGNVKERVPLWKGDTASYTVLNGFNQFNQATTVAIPSATEPGVDWDPLPGFALFNGTTLNFDLRDLFQWTNCDVLSSGPTPKTTVLGYFENYFNDETSETLSEQPSMLYFKPEGINSVAKFYNLIMNAPDGFKGFLSYQSSVSVGQKGAFLAITALNGRFYAQLLTNVTVPAPAAGTNYIPFSFHLEEVSATELVTLVESLDSLP